MKAVLLFLLGLFIAFLVWLGQKIFGGGGSAAPPPPLPLPPPYPTTGITTVAGGATSLPQGTWNGTDRQARRSTERYTFKRQIWNPLAAIGDQLTDAPYVAVRLRLQLDPNEQAAIVPSADVQPVPGTTWWAAITSSDGTVVVDVEVGPRLDENIFAESDMYVIAEEIETDGSVLRGASHKVRLVAPEH